MIDETKSGFFDQLENIYNEIIGFCQTLACQDVRAVTDGTDSSVVDQLESLYQEKDRLNRELGVSEPDEIINMVESLQEQLESLYAQQDETR